MTRTDPVLEQACDWVARLGDGAPDEAEWRDFRAWIEASAEHERAYDRALALDEAVGRMADAPALAAWRPRPARKAAPPLAWAAGLAACAVLAAGIGLVAQRAAAPAPAQTFAAGQGERRVLTLADGSQITLNSRSRLSVRLGRQGRLVDLEEGEAAFEVAADAARPFLVQAGGQSVRVVGTVFNVRRRDGLTEVAVREGRVEVRARDGAAPAVLGPGDLLALDEDDGAVAAVRTTAEDAFAWTEGRLVYRDRPLPEVVSELNRHLPRPLAFADRRLAGLKFSGVLRLGSEEAVLAQLTGLMPVAAAPAGDGVVLSARPGAF